MTATKPSFATIHKLTEKAYIALAMANRRSGVERAKYIIKARDYFLSADQPIRAAWCGIQLDS